MRATTFALILHPFSFQTGGGVWESNPPRHALAHPLTVLKTAPITGQDAPPELFRMLRRKQLLVCEVVCHKLRMADHKARFGGALSHFGDNLPYLSSAHTRREAA